MNRENKKYFFDSEIQEAVVPQKQKDYNSILEANIIIISTGMGLEGVAEDEKYCFFEFLNC